MQPNHYEAKNKDNRWKTVKQESHREYEVELCLNNGPGADTHVGSLSYKQINVLITTYGIRNGVLQRKYATIENYLGQGH